MRQPTRIVVDGESFDVVRQGGSTHFTWVSGPNASYGFSIGNSTASALTDKQVRSAILGFLSGIDPHTGYLAE